MRKFYKNKKIIILILSLLYGLTFTGINASAMESKENKENKEQSNFTQTPGPETQPTTISEKIQNMITQMGVNNAELKKIIESLNSSSDATSQTKEEGATTGNQ